MLFISGHFTGYCLRCRSPAMEDVLDQGGSGVVAFQGNDFEQAHPRPTAEAMLPQLQVFDATGVDVEQHGLEDVPQDYADGFFQVFRPRRMLIKRSCLRLVQRQATH